MTTHNKSKQTTMKTQLVFPGIVAASLTVIGCSQESRDNAIKRTSRAAVALNGGASDGTPDIVREQREREKAEAARLRKMEREAEAARKRQEQEYARAERERQKEEERRRR